MSPYLAIVVALRALGRNKLRTFLTMLGIIIGVAAVVAMLSIGNGAQAAISANMTAMGANTVDLYPGYRRGRRRGVAGSGVKMVAADWLAIRDLPLVHDSYPRVSHSAQLVYATSNWRCTIIGTTDNFFHIASWKCQSGRLFSDSEVNQGATVIVLGEEVRKELFGAVDPVGETVRVSGFPFKVIGVLEEKGGSGRQSRDNQAMMPYTTMTRRIKGEDRLQRITLQARSEEELLKLEKDAVQFLNDRHRVTNEKTGGFSSYNQAEAAEAAKDSARIFSLLLGGIASVSLLVGGIGVMNIMLVSVTERIREIGIRMAVGARGRDILIQFLLEAVVISLVGGAIGVGLGASIASWAAKLAGWPFVITESSVVLAFGTSALIGIFFGFYPAYSASKLDPIQALRKE